MQSWTPTCSIHAVTQWMRFYLKVTISRSTSPRSLTVHMSVSRLMPSHTTIRILSDEFLPYSSQMSSFSPSLPMMLQLARTSTRRLTTSRSLPTTHTRRPKSRTTMWHTPIIWRRKSRETLYYAVYLHLTAW